MNIKELNDLLYEEAQKMGEHFDSIQMIATLKDEDGNTQIHACGAGNFYARAGSAREWLIREEERCRIKVRTEE